MSHDALMHDTLDDESDAFEAVNDDDYGRPRPSRRETLDARRRLETLLEERRLRRAIEDDWAVDEEEE